jgi:hypothetical protein
MWNSPTQLEEFSHTIIKKVTKETNVTTYSGIIFVIVTENLLTNN